MGCKANEYHYKEEQNEIALSLGFTTPQEAMVKLYNSGDSFNDIGLKFGIRKETIRKRLNILKVKSRGKGGANNKLMLHVDCYIDVMFSEDTQKVIAKRHSISVPSVIRLRHGYMPTIVKEVRQ